MFARTVRHEYNHLVTCHQFWDSHLGYVGALDYDGDVIPDDVELTLRDANGMPFDPTKWDTDGDGISDWEELAYAAEDAWTNGSADHQDWCSPGHQTQ